MSTGDSEDRFVSTIQAGRSPNSVETPKAPALSMAWKNRLGSKQATITGGTRVSAKSRSFKGRELSSERLSKSAKKSVRATTKPTKDVTIALRENARMPLATSGLPVLRSTSSGSPAEPMGRAASTAAFHTTNIKNGTRLPTTMAVVILPRSPSSCALGLSLKKASGRGPKAQGRGNLITCNARVADCGHHVVVD